MDCLQSKCKYHHAKDGNYCDVLRAYVPGKCPVDSMVRYAADRLDGLKRVREYLEGISDDELR